MHALETTDVRLGFINIIHQVVGGDEVDKYVDDLMHVCVVDGRNGFDE